MRNPQFLFNHQKTLAKVTTQEALILMKYNNDLAKTEKIISIANFLVWTLFFIRSLVTLVTLQEIAFVLGSISKVEYLLPPLCSFYCNFGKFVTGYLKLIHLVTSQNNYNLQLNVSRPCSSGTSIHIYVYCQNKCPTMG